MALSILAKQLAQQAIGNSVKDVIDSLRPADLAKVSETIQTVKSPAQAQTENVCGTILGQIQAMQRALKEDDELVLLCNTGAGLIRVLEIFVPSWSVVVLTGIDTEKNVTRLISHVESVQLICKVMKVQAPAKPAKVAIIVPKPKSA